VKQSRLFLLHASADSPSDIGPPFLFQNSHFTDYLTQTLQYMPKEKQEMYRKAFIDDDIVSNVPEWQSFCKD
jgi:hypothetical protein